MSSCGNNEQKTNTSTTSDSSTVSKKDSNTTSTIDTNHQTMMVVWHKVADFQKWKASFESHDSMKLSFGIHNYVVGRNVEDSNLLMVATKADDVNKAKAFIKDPTLKTAMQKSGVTGPPMILLNTIVYQDTTPNISTVRSMTMFTVKDWDAWRKAFENGRQLRKDNGITDRAYGYDVDDNHKVTLVVAINDSAKANAFWKSDLIKQKRAESGVVGEVKQRLYRVAVKY